MAFENLAGLVAQARAQQQAQRGQRFQQGMEMGGLVGGGIGDIVQLQKQKAQKEAWMKSINTMMNDPNASPQMKQMLPMIAQRPELAGQVLPGLMKRPPSVFRPFPGQMSATGEPLVIDESTGDVRPAGIQAKATTRGGTPSAEFYEQLSPEQKEYIDKQVYEGNLSLPHMGYKEKGLLGMRASLYGKEHGGQPFQSFVGPVRESSARAFTSGKQSANVNALNTALGHLKTLQETYQNLGNVDAKLMNVPLNKLKQNVNDPNIMKTLAALNAVKGEAANVFKGSGATDQEIESWNKVFNENLTPSQMLGVIKTTGDLFNSRLSALQYQRDQGMGNRPGSGALLSPHASELLKGFGKENKPKDFMSISEAESAGLPSGTKITIMGRSATIQ